MEDRKEENVELDNDAEIKATDEMSDVEDSLSEQKGFEAEEIVSEVEADASEPIAAEEFPKARETSSERTVSSSGSSSSLPKMLALFGLIIAIGVGLVFWKNAVLGHHGEESSGISKKEMELLVKDFPPAQRKQLVESKEGKKKLIDSITELLAISSQAQKDGFASDPLIEKDLKFSEKAIYAANYDKKLNSDKGPMPPFGFITEDRVKEFWGEDKDMSGLSWIWNGAEKRRHEAEFRQFLDTKIALAKKSGQIPAGNEPSEEEIKQAKDIFAKTMIYYDEVKEKLASINSLPEEEQKEWKEFKETAELQIKLQKAQFLTQNYMRDVLAKKFEVTEEDIQKYLAEHPELSNSEAKKKLADEVLQKVKADGDFAELAKEYSEDPGSKSKGGLYEGIGEGQFAKEFEAAALALEPGQITPELVKTQFGYHIIKLEKKGEAKGADGKTKPTYDARHILISTMVKDPDNPAAREQPAEQLAKTKVAKIKQQQILDEIKENNPIEIAEDFEVPEVSEEELEKQKAEQMKMMQQQMQQQQMQQGGAPPKGQQPPAPPKPGAADPKAPQPKAEKK